MTDQVEFVPPSKGRGKVVMGYLILNIGLCLLLDTDLFAFSMTITLSGIALFLAGHFQHYFALKEAKRMFEIDPDLYRENRQTSLGAVILLCLTLLGVSSPAWSAVSPLSQIKEVDSDLKKFHKKPKEGELSAVQEKENQKIKNRILREDFDLREMCRLALDDQWAKLSAAQRNEFVELFTDLLLHNAILHSEKHSGQEKIEYLSEDPIDEFKGRIKVRTRVEVPNEAVDFDVDYAMVLDKDKDQWRIYDLMLDGESLMMNYRDQFHLIISKNSYNYLVQKMRKKLKEKK